MSDLNLVSTAKLFALTYISHSTIKQRELEQQLNEIEQIASERNAKHQVTGKLIYRNAYFMQRLEGDEQPLKDILESIMQDKRHRHIKVLHHGPIPKRLFSDWTQMQVITQSKYFSELDNILLDIRLLNEDGLNDLEAKALIDFFERFQDHPVSA